LRGDRAVALEEAVRSLAAGQLELEFLVPVAAGRLLDLDGHARVGLLEGRLQLLEDAEDRLIATGIEIDRVAVVRRGGTVGQVDAGTGGRHAGADEPGALEETPPGLP